MPVHNDPMAVAALMACHLIVLDKNPGIHPISICEVVRCIIAKAALSVVREDILKAVGFRQFCASHIAGAEAAAHAMRMFSS